MKSPLGRLDVAIGPHYQDRLSVIIRQEKPRVVVETGVETGFGAEYILQALDANGMGKLYSIDPAGFNYPTGVSAPPILHPRFTLIQKRSQDALQPLFEKVGPFDFFIHDSDHSFECQTYEYNAAWDMVRPGGIIASDDPFWGMPPHRAWDNFLIKHGITQRNIAGNAQWIRKP